MSTGCPAPTTSSTVQKTYCVTAACPAQWLKTIARTPHWAIFLPIPRCASLVTCRDLCLTRWRRNIEIGAGGGLHQPRAQRDAASKATCDIYSIHGTCGHRLGTTSRVYLFTARLLPAGGCFNIAFRVFTTVAVRPVVAVRTVAAVRTAVVMCGGRRAHGQPASKPARQPAS